MRVFPRSGFELYSGERGIRVSCIVLYNICMSGFFPERLHKYSVKCLNIFWTKRFILTHFALQIDFGNAFPWSFQMEPKGSGNHPKWVILEWGWSFRFCCAHIPVLCTRLETITHSRLALVSSMVGQSVLNGRGPIWHTKGPRTNSWYL